MRKRRNITTYREGLIKYMGLVRDNFMEDDSLRAADELIDIISNHEVPQHSLPTIKTHRKTLIAKLNRIKNAYMEEQWWIVDDIIRAVRTFG